MQTPCPAGWLVWFRGGGVTQAPDRAREIELARLRLRHHAVEIPPGVDRKCSAGFADTIAIAIAACSRPMAMQASPHRDFETPSSPRRLSAALTISGQAGVGVLR